MLSESPSEAMNEAMNEALNDAITVVHRLLQRVHMEGLPPPREVVLDPEETKRNFGRGGREGDVREVTWLLGAAAHELMQLLRRAMPCGHSVGSMGFIRRALRGHQRSSEVIRGHQTMGSVGFVNYHGIDGLRQQ
jgi:hypothetical protein